MSRKHKLAAGAAALVTAAGAGGAVAATSGSSTNRKAFLDDAAARLHVTPTQLQSALGGAYDDRLNAAVAAHKLTQAQAQQIESRIAHGGTPWLRLGGQAEPGRAADRADPRRGRLPRADPGAAAQRAEGRQVAGPDRPGAGEDGGGPRGGAHRSGEDPARHRGEERQAERRRGAEDPRRAAQAPEPAGQPHGVASTVLNRLSSSRAGMTGRHLNGDLHLR